MAKLISVQDLPPKLDKNAIRKVYRYGPYRVPGAKVLLTYRIER
jgi:hypothetical protein